MNKMKNIYFYLLATTLLSSFNRVSAQDIQQGFIIRKWEQGLLLVDVSEAAYDSYPADRKGRPYTDIISKNPMDPGIQKGMETSIFTSEVIIRHLRIGGPGAICKVDTAGNIVSVSFKLYSGELPAGELSMFAAFREQLKKEVTYKVSFPRGIAAAGYMSAIFPMFGYQILSHQDLYGLNFRCNELFTDQGDTQIICECYDSKYHMYMNLPAKDKSGNVLDGALTFQFSKQRQLDEIVQTLLTEQPHLSAFNPAVSFAVSANSGEIAAMSIQFLHVTDTTLIDLQLLEPFMERLKNEHLYEQILYDGKRAASGYLIHALRLFSSERKTDYSIPNLRDCPMLNKRNFLVRE